MSEQLSQREQEARTPWRRCRSKAGGNDTRRAPSDGFSATLVEGGSTMHPIGAAREIVRLADQRGGIDPTTNGGEPRH